MDEAPSAAVVRPLVHRMVPVEHHPTAWSGDRRPDRYRPLMSITTSAWLAFASADGFHAGTRRR
jgi:hypothetical protein